MIFKKDSKLRQKGPPNIFGYTNTLISLINLSNSSTFNLGDSLLALLTLMVARNNQNC